MNINYWCFHLSIYWMTESPISHRSRSLSPPFFQEKQQAAV
jgi:hypothetical protein